MVSPEVTQPAQPPHPRPTDWESSDESVRITAEARRHVIAEFLSDALTVQRAVAEGERIDRKASGGGAPHGLYTTADLRVSNAAAVVQWIASSLAGYSDNRDFEGVAK